MVRFSLRNAEQLTGRWNKISSYTPEPVGLIRSTVKRREEAPRGRHRKVRRTRERARMVESSDGSEVEGAGREGREGLGEVLLVVIF